MTNNNTISLAHGNGGRLMQELIQNVFAPAFGVKTLDTTKDAVALDLRGHAVISTDGFTVDPIFFPGGDIGKLAVCGTLNDLLVSGAIPAYLTVNFFIEEGYPISSLTSIATSMGQTARDNQVRIVAGDTKVLPRGNAAGIYIATTGIGVMQRADLSLQRIRTGDSVFISGTVGDHGTAVMLARQEFGLHGDLESDCSCVKPLVEKLLSIETLKFMRDPTRGGLAGVCHEIVNSTGLGVRLKENAIPVQDQVRTMCEILGYDPYQLACEGRVLFVCGPETDLAQLKQISEDICEIGVIEDRSSQVLLETSLGGQRIVPELEGEPLPRIC
ncbi:MAG: hydrogenase expression/formation protein HypE [Gammaproteobacteria bacterium]|nr:hydrogenase expression/formation protein HypE [Gammaproteobacteria bacterium]